MRFFTFRTGDFSEEEVRRLLEMIDYTRTGTGGILRLADVPNEISYVVFSDPAGATLFMCYLQKKEIPFEELQDLPAELKDSSTYKTFLGIM
jgi:hypothetical protein